MQWETPNLSTKNIGNATRRNGSTIHNSTNEVLRKLHAIFALDPDPDLNTLAKIANETDLPIQTLQQWIFNNQIMIRSCIDAKNSLLQDQEKRPDSSATFAGSIYRRPHLSLSSVVHQEYIDEATSDMPGNSTKDDQLHSPRVSPPPAIDPICPRMRQISLNYRNGQPGEAIFIPPSLLTAGMHSTPQNVANALMSVAPMRMILPTTGSSSATPTFSDNRNITKEEVPASQQRTRTDTDNKEFRESSQLSSQSSESSLHESGESEVQTQSATRSMQSMEEGADDMFKRSAGGPMSNADDMFKRSAGGPMPIFSGGSSHNYVRPYPMHEQSRRTYYRFSEPDIMLLRETCRYHQAMPSTEVQKQIAGLIKAPLRKIQIWFQNERARIRKLQRNSQYMDDVELLDVKNSTRPLVESSQQ